MQKSRVPSQQQSNPMASRLLQRAVLRPGSALRHACHAAAALGAAQPLQPHGPRLAPRREFAHSPLGGKNIFQLRAAAEVAAQTQQAKQGDGSNGGGAGKKGQQAAAAANANPYEGVVLPTSDESEELLRIRHSVRRRGGGTSLGGGAGHHGWVDRLALLSAAAHTTCRCLWRVVMGGESGSSGRPLASSWHFPPHPCLCHAAAQPHPIASLPARTPSVCAHHGDGGAAPFQGRAGHDWALDRARLLLRL
jgi:hypothetical protein